VTYLDAYPKVKDDCAKYTFSGVLPLKVKGGIHLFSYFLKSLLGKMNVIWVFLVTCTSLLCRTTPISVQSWILS